MSITPRTFAAVLGGVALLVGLIATMFASVSASHAGGLLSSYECGTVLAPRTSIYGGETLQACTDALGTRAMWGWTLVAVGGIVLVGALLVRTRPAQPTR